MAIIKVDLSLLRTRFSLILDTRGLQQELKSLLISH